MIKKLENGLYKVDCAVNPKYPNVYGRMYNIESYFEAISNNVCMCLTDASIDNYHHNTIDPVTTIGEIVELHHDVEEPHIIVKATNERIDNYLKDDWYAVVRAIVRHDDSKGVIFKTVFCYDLAKGPHVCNWNEITQYTKISLGASLTNIYVDLLYEEFNRIIEFYYVDYIDNEYYGGWRYTKIKNEFIHMPNILEYGVYIDDEDLKWLYPDNMIGDMWHKEFVKNVWASGTIIAKVTNGRWLFLLNVNNCGFKDEARKMLQEGEDILNLSIFR